MGNVVPKPPVTSWGFSTAEAERSFAEMIAESLADNPFTDQRLRAAADARRKARADYGIPETEFIYLDDPADIEDWARILVHRRKMQERRRNLMLVLWPVVMFVVLMVVIGVGGLLLSWVH